MKVAPVCESEEEEEEEPVDRNCEQQNQWKPPYVF
jgi:hypothetical protein